VDWWRPCPLPPLPHSRLIFGHAFRSHFGTFSYNVLSTLSPLSRSLSPLTTKSHQNSEHALEISYSRCVLPALVHRPSSSSSSACTRPSLVRHYLPPLLSSSSLTGRFASALFTEFRYQITFNFDLQMHSLPVSSNTLFAHFTQVFGRLPPFRPPFSVVRSLPCPFTFRRHKSRRSPFPASFRILFVYRRPSFSVRNLVFIHFHVDSRCFCGRSTRP
jgi:hypothetical protein